MSVYTDHEIVFLYKEAKHKKAQIGILCDLTEYDRNKVISILEAAGFKIKSKPRVTTETNYGSQWSENDVEKLKQLVEQKLKRPEIAEILGRTIISIDYKMRREGFYLYNKRASNV